MTAVPNLPLNLRELAFRALCEADPTAKVNLVLEMREVGIFSLLGFSGA